MAWARNGVDFSETKNDLTALHHPKGSEKTYEHSLDAILARTGSDEGAASEDHLMNRPLRERKKELGAGGFRFEDIVRVLIRDLSSPLRKTLTKGDVFPIPCGSFLEQPPFEKLEPAVREVVRGMVSALNNVFDCVPTATQRVSPLHVRIILSLSQEALKFLEKSGSFESCRGKSFFGFEASTTKGKKLRLLNALRGFM